MENQTYAIVSDRHGHEEARYLLADDDLLDPDFYAAKWADSVGVEFDTEENGLIPDGGEDFSVVITENPDNPSICWTSANYMIKGE